MNEEEHQRERDREQKKGEEKKKSEEVAPQPPLATTTTTTATTTVMPPAEQFRQFIKSKGIKLSSPRSSWPLPTLLDAHHHMTATVPPTMLSNELFTGASTPSHWLARQRTYACSLASSSVLGHLVGLGDRHLDNILFHTVSGSIIHVDFAVLFDRGLKLTVPEVVPFRLTQSLVEGLGVEGVGVGARRQGGGVFAETAEKTLRAIRDNYDTFSTLLQLHVEDPWVDWTPEISLKSTRIAFEQCCALTSFISRFSTDNEQKKGIEGMAEYLNSVYTHVSPFLKEYMATAAALACIDAHQERRRRAMDVVHGKELSNEQAAIEEDIKIMSTSVEELSAKVAVATTHAMPLLSACSAMHAQHEAILTAIFDGHVVSALSGDASQWNPTQAPIPLAAVQASSTTLSSTTMTMKTMEETTIVGRALLIHDPSQIPLQASLLLRAATMDDFGREAMARRAVALTAAVGAVETYARHVVMAAGQHGWGVKEYLELGCCARWLPLLQAAVADPPLIDSTACGTEASSLALPTPTQPLSTQHVRLQTLSSMSDVLLRNLQASKSMLSAARIDAALFAATAREELVSSLSVTRGSWNQVLDALASFTTSQADLVSRYTSPATTTPAEVLDGLQQLVLGFGTVVLTVQQHTTESTYDGGIIAPWLTKAVQLSDNVSSAAGELQVLVVSCCCPLLLLHSRSSSQDAFQGCMDRLEGALELGAGADVDRVMGCLMEMNEGWDGVGQFGEFLRCIQSLCHAARSLEEEEEGEEEEWRMGGSTLSEVRSRVYSVRRMLPTLNKVMEGLVISGSTEMVQSSDSGSGSDSGSTDSDDSDEEGAGAPSTHLSIDRNTFECLELGAVVLDVWKSLKSRWEEEEKGEEQEQQPPDTDGGTKEERLWQGLSQEMGQAVSALVQLHLLPSIEGHMRKTAEELMTMANSATTTTQEEEEEEEALALHLPAFFDFGDSEPLDPRGIKEDGEDEASDEVDKNKHLLLLLPLLESCAESAGTLAVIDAALYVTTSTLQTATDLAHTAATALASFDWLHDLSGSASKYKGEHIRKIVLQRLEEAVEQCEQAQKEVEEWQQAPATTTIYAQVQDELHRIAPHVAPLIASGFGAAIAWNARAGDHVAAVVQALTSVLEFEASRDEKAREESEARYTGVIEEVREAKKELKEAVARVGEKEQALASLRQRQQDARASIVQAEEEIAKGTSEFSKHVLPLVKATQKMSVYENSENATPPALALHLQRLQRTLNLLPTTTSTSESSSTLDDVASVLLTLPPTLDQFSTTIHSARRLLLQSGGRGELAARQQAKQIVPVLKSAVEEVGPLVNSLASVVIPALRAFDAKMASYIRKAKEERDRLCREYGLCITTSSGEGEEAEVQLPPHASSSSPHLYPPSSYPRLQETTTPNALFAKNVVDAFKKKVYMPCKRGEGEGEEEGVMAVAEQVKALADEATDVRNLARMYEGWMPWV